MEPQQQEKIVKFMESDKDLGVTLDKEEILKRLSAIPQGLANEYVYDLALHFEDWLTIRNVILSIGHPATLRSLLETLPESLFGRLNKIALQLASKDPGIDEVVAATLNVVIPTEETRYKAANLIHEIKGLNIDRQAKAKTLMKFAKNLELLANAMIILNKGNEFTDFVFDQLSRIPESDLEEIILIAKNSY